MKKLLYLILTGFFLSSCSYVEYSQRKYYADFSSYTANGFIISPVATGFEYEPVGLLEMEFEYGVRNPKADKLRISLYPEYKDCPPERNVRPSLDYMVSEMAIEAQKEGANGLLNFSIETKYETVSGLSIPRKAIARGFAVRIKNVPTEKENAE